MKIFQRKVERYPRPIKRNPRDYGQRLPRPIKRFPRVDRRLDGFPPLYKLECKPKDKFPELFEDLQTLKEKFKKKGRKISIYCMKAKHICSIETCICRCKKKCEAMNFRNLVGQGEGPSEYIDDFIRLQRLVNMIYGTVRERDIKLIDNTKSEK